MSDGEWRALERRWRESGAPEDGAAFLRARLRVGDIDAHRVELLAHLGHGPARLLLERQPTSTFPELPLESPQAWDAWFAELPPPDAGGPPYALDREVTDLSPWGREACVRAGRAAVTLALGRGAAPTELEREGLEAVDRWLAAGWEGRRDQRRELRRIWRGLEKAEPGSAYAALPAILNDTLEGSSLAAAVAAVVDATDTSGPEHSIHTAIGAAAHLLEGEHSLPAAAAPRVRAAVRAELAPWILTAAPHLYDQRTLDKVVTDMIQRSHWFGESAGGSGHLACVSPGRHELLWVAPEGDGQRVITRYSIHRESEFGSSETVFEVSLLVSPEGEVSERRELGERFRDMLSPNEDDD